MRQPEEAVCTRVAAPRRFCALVSRATEAWPAAGPESVRKLPKSFSDGPTAAGDKPFAATCARIIASMLSEVGRSPTEKAEGGPNRLGGSVSVVAFILRPAIRLAVAVVLLIGKWVSALISP